MKRIRSKPVVESDYADIEDQLRALFKKLIFSPLVELLAPRNAQVKSAARQLRNSLENAKYDAIIAGINSGKIQYVDGTFSGDFNAAISGALKKYGALFNKRTSTWSIIPQALPVEVLKAITQYQATARKLHEDLEDKLRNMQFTLSYEIQENPIDPSKMISKTDKKFNAEYGDALGTESLSPEAKKRLSRRYAQSLAPYIKKFSDEQIKDLRAMVKANGETGYRFDRLVDQVEQRYSVTKSKAEFLARQETAMFVSKARQTRFEDAGVTEYIWRTSGDSEVRDSHKKLNGRTFKYSQPPVVDEVTGRRGNPGQDYNCRCVDEALLPALLEVA